MRRIFCSIAILLCFLSVSNTAQPSDKDDGVLRYKIPVIAGVERFVEVLEYPTYLSIALQNIGIRIAGNYLVKIKDKNTFSIEGVEAKFIKKDGNLLYYQLELPLSLMPTKEPLSLAMVVDVSELHNKVIGVSVFSSFVKYVPENIREKIKNKIEKLTSENNQEKMLVYFNKLSGEKHQNNTIHGLLEGIIFDTYNTQCVKSINDIGLAKNYFSCSYIIILLIIGIATLYYFRNILTRKKYKP